jgi:hypothetical protein
MLVNGITESGVSGPLTPKRAFFYWGNETMSFMRYMTLASFRHFNPDWEIVLITHDGGRPRWQSTEEIDKYTYDGPDYSSLLKGLKVTLEPHDAMWTHGLDQHMTDVHCKDLSMWYLLATRGGVIADMDILFINPMDELNLDCDVGLVCFEGYPRPGYIPVTFMAGTPNRFFNECHRNALMNYDPEIYECCGNNSIEFDNIEILAAHYPELIVKRLKDRVVFPFVEDPYEIACVKAVAQDHCAALHSNSVGIHWYAGNPVVNRIVQTVTHKNVNKQEGTIFKIASGMLSSGVISIAEKELSNA